MLNEAVAAFSGGGDRRRATLEHGFCFRFKTPDHKRRVFVNVCGHSSIGAPQGHSGVPVDAEFIAAHGVDNLQIPIAVSPVQTDSDASSSPGIAICTVDVVVSPSVSSVCQSVWRIGNMDEVPKPQAAVVARMIVLALEWVKRETGLSALPSTVKIVTDLAYRAPLLSREQRGLSDLEKAFNAIKKMSPADMEAVLRRDVGEPSVAAESEADPAPSLPDVFKLSPRRKEPTKPRGPMVSEVRNSEPIIKRGFLNRPEGPGLYGEEGTAEGVLPEGAGDPLGYLPKSLRAKCKIVDARSSHTSTAPPTVPSVASPNLAAPSPAAVRITNGIVIEDLPPKADLLPSYVAVTCGDQLRVTVDLAAASEALDVPILSMAQLDLTTEPTLITCRLEPTLQPLFSFSAADGWGQRPSSLPSTTTTAARDLDVECARAQFIKSKRVLIITVPWQ